MSSLSTPWGIVANVLSDRALRTGARVWVLRCNGDAENPVVRGLSKHGRLITKYTKFRRLTNYRAAMLPPGLPDEAWPSLCYRTKEEAAAWAALLESRWRDVQYTRPDGVVCGTKPTREVWK